jgi:uncharacterized protein (DUF486 family)
MVVNGILATDNNILCFFLWFAWLQEVTGSTMNVFMAEWGAIKDKNWE